MPTGYYQKNKKRLRKETRESYQNLSPEERKLARERSKNLSE